MFDPRLAKFSLTKAELDGLEAAIQLLAVVDARSLYSDKPDQANLRVQALSKRRNQAANRVGGEIPLSGGGGLRSKLGKAEAELRPVVEKGFRDATPLKRALALVEVLTAQPYVPYGGDAAQEWKLSASHRDKVGQWVLGGSYGITWLEGLRGSLMAAESSHSHFWRNASFAVLVVGLLAVGGVFAAPFLGGIIGAAMGLGGAAAVSAGLAALGGGALAAGGFGMLGGTVVIAAAFGAAGGGGVLLFAGDGGDVVARLAAIKAQAVFDHLLKKKLMDHTLAGDFIDSFQQQAKHYREAAESAKDQKARGQLKKVVEAFEKAQSWCSERYGEAVKNGEVVDEPVAWSRPSKPEPDVQEPSFKETAASLAAAQERLGYVRDLVKNAHRTYAEVKDAPYLKGLWGELSKSSRKRLQAGGAVLQVVLDEVMRLAIDTELAAEAFATAVTRTAEIKEQRDQARRLLQTYREVVARLHAEVGRLTAEKAELTAKVETLQRELNRSTSRAFVVNARSVVLLAGRRSLPSPGDAGEPAPGNGAYGAAVAGANADVWLARALVPSDAAFDGVAPADETLRLPSQAEIDEVLESLGLPIGASAREVKAAYRKAMAEVHPDKLEGLGQRQRRLSEAERRRVQLAYRMHLRYLAARGGAPA